MTHPSATATRPLEPGDRLERAEFHRRYLASPHVRKAELVEGPSPVRTDQHGSPHLALATWLGTYLAAAPGVTGGDNACRSGARGSSRAESCPGWRSTSGRCWRAI